jgi:hypothetical protein
MSDDLIEALRLQGWNEAADRIEQLEAKLAEAEAVAKIWQEDFIQENNRWGDALRDLDKAVEALPKLHAVLDILLNNFPTKARPKWVADTERHIDEAIAVLAELEGGE